MSKPRVMYILGLYPAVSETYIQNEIDALCDEYEIKIITFKHYDLASKHHHPFREMDDPVRIREAIKEFRPHVLHSHFLTQLPFLSKLARRTHVPFTIRSHSFDSIWEDNKPPPSHIRSAIPAINDDLCLGILAFPFTRANLERAGIRGEKINDCYPVVNYERFLDRSPNGQAVMTGGAGLPKKKMEDFLELAVTLPETEFNLYALGHDVEKIGQLNEKLGKPVNMIPPVEPDAMPLEYKKHKWLVHTAAPDVHTRGWPIMIAEAQASGVGVCMRNIRPDLKEYVGECGFLYDSINEVRDIISRPFPDEMRQIGFEHARKSDIQEHKHVLTNLWQKAITDAGSKKKPHRLGGLIGNKIMEFFGR